VRPHPFPVRGPVKAAPADRQQEAIGSDQHGANLLDHRSSPLGSEQDRLLVLGWLGLTEHGMAGQPQQLVHLTQRPDLQKLRAEPVVQEHVPEQLDVVACLAD
jgi:hypothetical protein